MNNISTIRKLEKDDLFTLNDTEKWQFLKNPFVPDFSSCRLSSVVGSKVVGRIKNVFVELKKLDRVVLARCGGDFNVNNRYRGRGVRLFKCWMEIPYYPYFGFPNKRAFLLETHLGVYHLGTVLVRFRILDMKKYLMRRINNGLFVRLGDALWKAASALLFERSVIHRDIAIEIIDRFDRRFDEFWKAISDEYKIVVVRDSRYLNWRFADSPRRHSIRAAKRGEKVTGYVVLFKNKIEDMLLGHIVDLMVKAGDAETLDALVSEALSYFKKEGCVKACCALLTAARPYHAVLTKRGFIGRRVSSYLAGYSDNAEDLALMKNPNNWFVTFADNPDF